MNFLVTVFVSVLVLAACSDKETVNLKFVSAIKNGKDISNDNWKIITVTATAEFKDGKLLYDLDFHAASSLKYHIEYELFKGGEPKITSVSETPTGDASQDLKDAQDFIKHVFADFDEINGKGNDGCFEAKSGDKVCFREK